MESPSPPRSAMESLDLCFESFVPETEFQDGGGEDVNFISDDTEEDEVIVIHSEDDAADVAPVRDRKDVIDLESQKDSVFLLGSEEGDLILLDTEIDDPEGCEKSGIEHSQAIYSCMHLHIDMLNILLPSPDPNFWASKTKPLSAKRKSEVLVPEAILKKPTSHPRIDAQTNKSSKGKSEGKHVAAATTEPGSAGDFNSKHPLLVGSFNRNNMPLFDEYAIEIFKKRLGSIPSSTAMELEENWVKLAGEEMLLFAKKSELIEGMDEHSEENDFSSVYSTPDSYESELEAVFDEIRIEKQLSMKVIHDLFHDNKHARAMQLEHQFRTTIKGSTPMATYCQELRNIADWLDDVDAPVSEHQFVLQMLRGLPDDLQAQTSFIQFQDPLPSFLQVRSALFLLDRQQTPLGSSNSTALLAGHGGSSHAGGQHGGTGGRGSSSGGGQFFGSSYGDGSSSGQRGGFGRGQGRGNGNRGRGRGRQNSGSRQRPPTDGHNSWNSPYPNPNPGATTSRSSAEAEYRAVANAVAETSWIRNLLLELQQPLRRATLVFCDNVSAVYLSSNPVQHQRTKHVEVDIHFVRDKVALGQIRVLHVPSSSQPFFYQQLLFCCYFNTDPSMSWLRQLHQRELTVLLHKLKCTAGGVWVKTWSGMKN
ncbi:unnamed protein product [Cuscuta campestris]|uniref:Reverse transcriptase Ty1/copia-type domain-containing protein n=1 Tax=Cuscuta campestris TaxID=132261 RepID=A0A484MY56_9ASTE|nr:unnamed protein product [Cuscuta campestris]